MPDSSAARVLEPEESGQQEARLRFTPGERDIFRRVPFMAPSEWAEKNYMVMDGPHAGTRWRNSLTPYLAGIMDAWAQDGVELVVVEGSPQTGKTATLHICLGYSVDRRPGPKMLAMDNEGNLGKVADNKLVPNFKASPVLRSKLVSKKSTEMRFRDGSVCYLAAASSASQRASVSVRDLFMDEPDLYEAQEEKAHPVDELLERTTSFSDSRKVLMISKPLGFSGESSIENALENCDEVRQRRVSCPACRHEQVMTDQGLVALHGETDTQRIRREKLGRYACQDCGTLWSDNYRNWAVKHGSWWAERPVREPVSIGFHLPALVSPFVSLSEILADKLEAEADGTPSKLMHYHNSRLASAWRPVVSETPAEQVLELVDATLEPRVVPAGAAWVTAGIDMQRSGFWFGVWAWSQTYENWLVDYGYLPDFDSVRSLVFETAYPVEGSGRTMPIHRAGLDTGGGAGEGGKASMTEQAYQFVRGCPSGRLYAVKGAPRQFEKRVLPKAIGKMPSTKSRIPGGLNLYFLDTGWFKELVHASLRIDAAQPMHLHAETGKDFAEQITAERQVLRKKKLLWEKIRRDNHLLDCAMIARACASPEWPPSMQGLWVARRQMEERERLRAAQDGAGQTPAQNPYTRGRGRR
jgi:phage terminase large subunit GpA-like protein